MAEGEKKMKKGIHAGYMDCTVTCACGESFKTKSNKESISVEVCSKCHPFYTGTQKGTTRKGNVDKFYKKYGMTEDEKA